MQRVNERHDMNGRVNEKKNCTVKNESRLRQCNFYYASSFVLLVTEYDSTSIFLLIRFQFFYSFATHPTISF